ncbi:LLM class flavin-dependent oxidoreductase [Natrialba swarupiae]|nr:LLM class flavin-dependent oxidoreductase [Natrialba swarupiae]
MAEFGININNREPLLVESYTVERMLDLGEAAGENGFDSVWVGDSLLDRPRLEPISLLGNLAARTDDVKLGTGCMITPASPSAVPAGLEQPRDDLRRADGARCLYGSTDARL